MILKSLMNVRIRWNPDAYIRILDKKCPKYAVTLFVFHKGEWLDMFERCNFSYNDYFSSGIFKRLKWRFKVHGILDNKLQLLYDEIYDEEGKNVGLIFEHDVYQCHIDWAHQTLDLAKKYKFIPLIFSKYCNRLKKEFPTQQNLFLKPEDYVNNENRLYSCFNIKRNDLQSATGNSWESDGIFFNNSVFLESWHHKTNWTGMDHKEIFNDIMFYE